jgi:hypothetical protein
MTKQRQIALLQINNNIASLQSLGSLAQAVEHILGRDIIF